ncbi:MAG: sulfotransferase [Planctomycetota bacterium]|nr:sulfotransferase [Planctomycetota bacterium]
MSAPAASSSRVAEERRLADLRKAVRAQPNDANAHYQLAETLRGLGELDEAITHYRALTDLQPEIAGIWCNLGATLRAAGRAGESLDALQQARALDPTLIQAHTNLVAAFVEMNDAPRALDAARRAIEAEPDHPLVQWSVAGAFRLAGELETAAGHLRAAVRLDPASPLLRCELGDLLRRLERSDEADAAYGQALRLDPHSVDALIGRMKGRSQTGRSAEAREMARGIAQRFPMDAAAVHAAAEEYLNHNLTAEAAALIQPRLNGPGLEPGERRALLFALCEALDQLGRYEDAWAAAAEANRLKRVRLDRAALERQVDAVIAAFDADSIEGRPRAEAGPVRPLFIVGMPRSGTSLLEQILASHPQVTGGGEMNLMSRVVGRVETIAGAAEPYPACVKRLCAEGRTRLAAFAAAELGKVAHGNVCVTEKTPDTFRYLGFVEQLFPNARVIFCLRDPRDVGLSCFFHDFTGDHPWAYDLADLGRYCREYERLVAHWRATLGLPMMDVRYEDLVENQAPVTRHLLEFCGLPWDARCLAFHENRRPVHTASAGQVRRRLYGSSIGRYRRYEAHLGPLLRALESPAAKAVTGDGANATRDSR